MNHLTISDLSSHKKNSLVFTAKNSCAHRSDEAYETFEICNHIFIDNLLVKYIIQRQWKHTQEKRTKKNEKLEELWKNRRKPEKNFGAGNFSPDSERWNGDGNGNQSLSGNWRQEKGEDSGEIGGKRKRKGWFSPWMNAGIHKRRTQWTPF